MTIGTRLFTYFNGRLVGSDPAGNRYFEDKRATQGTRLDGKRRRWVMYAGVAEPTLVPPEWHAWLHYTVDEPIPLQERRVWQLPHAPNLTGTAASYRPAGHDYRGGRRPAATGDYEPWTPGS